MPALDSNSDAATAATVNRRPFIVTPCFSRKSTGTATAPPDLGWTSLAPFATDTQPADAARNISSTGATRTRSGLMASSNASISASSAWISSVTAVL